MRNHISFVSETVNYFDDDDDVTGNNPVCNEHRVLCLVLRMTSTMRTTQHNTHHHLISFYNSYMI